jgi:hypothetical protein
VDRAGCELVQCCYTVYNNVLWHLLAPWKLKHFREIAFQLCVTDIILVLNLSLLLRVLLSFPFWSVLINDVSMRMLLQFNFLFSRSLVKQLDQCVLMFWLYTISFPCAISSSGNGRVVFCETAAGAGFLCLGKKELRRGGDGNNNSRRRRRRSKRPGELRWTHQVVIDRG